MGNDNDIWHNSSKVDAYVQASVHKVQAAFADGFNIDIEVVASEKAGRSSYTLICPFSI